MSLLGGYSIEQNRQNSLHSQSLHGGLGGSKGRRQYNKHDKLVTFIYLRKWLRALGKNIRIE